VEGHGEVDRAGLGEAAVTDQQAAGLDRELSGLQASIELRPADRQGAVASQASLGLGGLEHPEEHRHVHS